MDVYGRNVTIKMWRKKAKDNIDQIYVNSQKLAPT
jgi:hypothetical protein